jgi:hypothetical protein
MLTLYVVSNSLDSPDPYAPIIDPIDPCGLSLSFNENQLYVLTNRLNEYGYNLPALMVEINFSGVVKATILSPDSKLMPHDLAPSNNNKSVYIVASKEDPPSNTYSMWLIKGQAGPITYSASPFLEFMLYSAFWGAFVETPKTDYLLDGFYITYRLVFFGLIIYSLLRGKEKIIVWGGTKKIYEEIPAKGVSGGVFGVLAAINGFSWIAILQLFLRELSNYSLNMGLLWSLTPSTYQGYAAIITLFSLPLSSPFNFFLESSFVLAILVFIFGTTLGSGFRNLYSKSSSYKGSAYLAAIRVGMLIASVLIAIGGWFQTIVIQFSNYVSTVGAIFIPLRLPATSYIIMGEILLGAVLILLGVASIDTRNSVERRKSSLAAGVLSIISGVVFALPFAINTFFAGQVAIAPSYGFSIMSTLISGFVLFTMFALVGFGLLLAASVLWTRVFLGFSVPK